MSTAGPGANDVGSSRHHLMRSVDASLKRLGTDYIDLYQLRAFDAITPVEETLNTLDDLVRAGKLRYVGCSNFSGWHPDEVARGRRQASSAALRRASGLLFARGQGLRVGAHAARARSQVPEDYLFRRVDALDEVARESGKTVPQVALNWLLRRPTVANVIIGARNEEQLKQNLGAIGWALTAEQTAQLDAASATPMPYPYWHQAGFAERNPAPV